MKIRYKTITVEVPGVKPTTCSCCGKTPKPRGLGIHHTKYEYPVEMVRNCHKLALFNTIWLCFFCHRIANSMRICEENKEKVVELSRHYYWGFTCDS